jgi:AraC-like DNA-binding protein
LAFEEAYGPAVLSCGRLYALRGKRLCFADPRHYRLYGIDDGAITLHVGGQKEEFFIGELVFIPPKWMGYMEFSQGTSLHFIFFDVMFRRRKGPASKRRDVRGEPAQPGPKEVWGVDFPRRVPAELTPLGHRMIERVRGEYWRSVAGYLRASAQLALFLGEFAVWLEEHNPKARDPDAETDLVSLAFSTLRDPNLNLPRAKELAQRLEISREHLSRQFHKLSGMPLCTVIQNERWQRVLIHLEDTNLSINQVGKKAGYTQTASFSRAFRKRFKRSPRSYRRWLLATAIKSIPKRTR